MRYRYRPEQPPDGDDAVKNGRKKNVTPTPISPLPFSPSSPSRLTTSVATLKKGLRYFSPPSPPPPAPLPTLSSLPPPVIPSSSVRTVEVHPVPPPPLPPPVPPPPFFSPAPAYHPPIRISPPIRPPASPSIVSTLPLAGPSRASRKEAPVTSLHTPRDGLFPLSFRVSDWLSSCAVLLRAVSLDTCFVLFGVTLVFFSRYFLTLIMVLDALRLMYWDAVKKWLLDEDRVAMEMEIVEMEENKHGAPSTVQTVYYSAGSGSTPSTRIPMLEKKENAANAPRNTLGRPPQGKMRTEARSQKREGEEEEPNRMHRIEVPFRDEKGMRRAATSSPVPSSLFPVVTAPPAAPQLPSSSFSRGIRARSSSLPSSPLGAASPSMPLVRLALMASMTTATTLRWRWTQCLSMAISISEFLETSYPIRHVWPFVFSAPFVASNPLLGMALEHSYFFVALLLTSWLLPFVCLVYSVLTGAQWVVLGGLRLLLQHDVFLPDISTQLFRVLGEEMPTPNSSAFSSDGEESTHDKAEELEEEDEEEMEYYWEEESEKVSLARRPHSSSTTSSSGFSFFSESSSLSATATLSTAKEGQHHSSGASAKMVDETKKNTFFSRSHFLPYGSEKKDDWNVGKDGKTTPSHDGVVKPFPEIMETRERRRHTPELPSSKPKRGRRKKIQKKSSFHRSLSVRPFIQVLDSTPSMASTSTAATNLFLTGTKREESGRGRVPRPHSLKTEKKERCNSARKTKAGEVGRREGEFSAASHPFYRSTAIATTWYREHLREVLFPPSSFFSSSEESPDVDDPSEMYRMILQLLVIAVALIGLGWQLTHYGSGVPWLFWPFILPLQILNQLTLALT